MGRDGSSSWLWMGGRSALRSVQPIHYRSRNREENFLFNRLVIRLINDEYDEEYTMNSTISITKERRCVVYLHFEQESIEIFEIESFQIFENQKKKEKKSIITSLTDQVSNLDTKDLIQS